nr:transcription initiation factor TFIID subunit 1 isoform X1 [Tanacetum cinerariifolium]
MSPKFLGLGYKNYNKTANVSALQETSNENKASRQLLEKRKTELTVKESRLAKLDMEIRECELITKGRKFLPEVFKEAVSLPSEEMPNALMYIIYYKNFKCCAASGVQVYSSAISKFAHGQRMSYLLLQQQTREKCQEIWDRQ